MDKLDSAMALMPPLVTDLQNLFLNKAPALWLLVPYVVFQRPFRWWCERSQFYTNNREWCKDVMVTYNVVMSLYSAVTWVLIWYCCAYTLPNGVTGLNHFDESTGIYERASFLFYFSKYVEFADTYFLILANRDVSWLQWIHHVGAPVIMAWFYYTRSECMWLFSGNNGLIHLIMYYYYAACIKKWPFPLPKHLLTSMQIVQFFFGIGFGTLVYAGNPTYWANVEKRNAYVASLLYVAGLIALFGNFFLQTYVRGKSDGGFVGCCGAIGSPRKAKVTGKKD